MAYHTIINVNKILPVLKYIKENPSEEGKKAKQAFYRMLAGVLFIILIFTIPVTCYAYSFNYENSFEYPIGATKYENGKIGLYDDFFWYRVDGERYEVDLKIYAKDEIYEPGEDIYIYLDDNNQVIGISHTDVMENKILTKLVIPLLVAIFGSVLLIVLHYVVGSMTYGKHWYRYMKWYYEEVAE